MKPGAWLVNSARGDMVDKAALIDALTTGRIAGAFLDTVDPEPLPPEDPLWRAPNAIHSMHPAGRRQTSLFPRGAALFHDNLAAFREGRPTTNVTDLDTGYQGPRLYRHSGDGAPQMVRFRAPERSGNQVRAPRKHGK